MLLAERGARVARGGLAGEEDGRAKAERAGEAERVGEGAGTLPSRRAATDEDARARERARQRPEAARGAPVEGARGAPGGGDLALERDPERDLGDVAGEGEAPGDGAAAAADRQEWRSAPALAADEARKSGGRARRPPCQTGTAVLAEQDAGVAGERQAERARRVAARRAGRARGRRARRGGARRACWRRPEATEHPRSDAHGRGRAEDAQHVEEARGAAEVVDEEPGADHVADRRDLTCARRTRRRRPLGIERLGGRRERGRGARRAADEEVERHAPDPHRLLDDAARRSR